VPILGAQPAIISQAVKAAWALGWSVERPMTIDAGIRLRLFR